MEKTELSLPAITLLWLIKTYQLFLSHFLSNSCRFYPSCSVYAKEVIMNLGFWRGIRLMLLRLLRCQPFCAGGFDPAPEKMVKDNRQHAGRYRITKCR